MELVDLILAFFCIAAVVPIAFFCVICIARKICLDLDSEHAEVIAMECEGILIFCFSAEKMCNQSITNSIVLSYKMVIKNISKVHY